MTKYRDVFFILRSCFLIYVLCASCTDAVRVSTVFSRCRWVVGGILYVCVGDVFSGYNYTMIPSMFTYRILCVCACVSLHVLCPSTQSTSQECQVSLILCIDLADLPYRRLVLRLLPSPSSTVDLLKCAPSAENDKYHSTTVPSCSKHSIIKARSRLSGLFYRPMREFRTNSNNH